MGLSNLRTYVGEFCFNGAKYAQLGWITDKTRTIPPTDGAEINMQIASVVDYETTGLNVLINIEGPANSDLDYYIMFNSPTSFNKQVREYP